MIATLVVLTALVLLICEWKTSFIRNRLDSVVLGVKQGVGWVGSPRGVADSVAEQIQIRDFYRDGIVETAEGIFWAGFEAILPVTDGKSTAELNELSDQLNRVLTGLRAGTHVQTFTSIDPESLDIIAAAERRAAAAREPYASVLRSRVKLMRKEARAGRLKTVRTYIFIGRPARQGVMKRLRLRSLFSPSEWTDLAQGEYIEMREEVRRERETFQSYFRSAGGECRDITDAREVMTLVYQRLNPARSKSHPCPAYEYDVNLRNLICVTGADVSGHVIHWEDGVQMTSLFIHRLPVRACSTTIERFTRSTAINFPVEISTTFVVADSTVMAGKFEEQMKFMTRSLAGSFVPNASEQAKHEQVASLQQELVVGEEGIGAFSFAVTIAANSEAELRRNEDKVLAEVRKCEGMELLHDRTNAFHQHLSTLPCMPHRDARAKTLTTRDAAHLMGWSGGSRGLKPEEAVIVYQRADGGALFFDQNTARHEANMTCITGGIGTGKSSLLKFLGFHQLAIGRRGVVIDYRASGHRLVELAGGVTIDITNPNSAKFVGLFFDIYPRPGEQYKADELTPEGLPRARLAELMDMLEKLYCANTKKSSLNPVARSFFEEQVQRVFANRHPEIPVMDDIIVTLRNVTKDKRSLGEKLAAGLARYKSSSALGLYFNSEETEDLSKYPLICLDFQHAKQNPELLLIGTIAARVIMDRYLFEANKLQGSFLHIDELQMISKFPLLGGAVEDVARTGRKYNCHVVVASQNISDFAQGSLKAIAANCPVKYLLDGIPQEAQEVFNLPLGIANMLASLKSSHDFREAVLVSPSTVATIQVRYSPTEGRVFMEAPSNGIDRFNVAEALAFVPGEVPERLRTAIELVPGKKIKPTQQDSIPTSIAA